MTRLRAHGLITIKKNFQSTSKDSKDTRKKRKRTGSLKKHRKKGERKKFKSKIHNAHH